MSKLPSVVSSLPQDLKAFINQVREALDGRNGEKLVTVNDLIRGGLAAPGPGNTVVPPAGVVGTPSTPKNVQANGAIQNIIVTWDDPLYNGHAYAEVWGSSTDDLGAAVQVGMTPGAIFVDAVGPSVIRYYWVRFVNVLGVQGAFNAVAGVQGETGADVEYLLETLTGAITETQLFSDLSDRIDNIELNTAAIETEAITRQTADTSLASQITTVSAATSTNTAAIQTEITTRASETGDLFAKYTVKVDLNGYVSGFGLASTANNATPFSDFAIRADRFYVASPSGPGITPIIPFIVTTTEQIINGVTVPVGVYINGAFIQNGTITNAKIGNAAIDDAKIVNLSAAKITAGSIGVGSFIESTGFITGSQGWRIHGNGFAEFGAAAIRGQLTASQINSNGLSIRDTSGNIILNAGTGVFNGTTSASNVSGLGALATQNTVSGTTQVTGLGGFAFISSITSANISTYIAGAAIGTAYISNAAITEALIANGAITNAKIGNAAITSAKIQDGEITNAKIGTAAITSAKIGTAEVDTIKIAGNAVTVPVSAFTAGSVTNDGSGWQTIQSVSITTSGSRVFVATAGTAISVSSESGTTFTPFFRIARNGVELMRGGREAIALSFSDTPPAGSYTYELQMIGDPIGTAEGPIASNRSIFVIETKR